MNKQVVLIPLLLLMLSSWAAVYGSGSFGSGRGYNGAYWLNGQYYDGITTFGYGYYDKIAPSMRYGADTYQFRQYNSAYLPGSGLYAGYAGYPTGQRGYYLRYGYNVFSPRQRYGVQSRPLQYVWN